MIFFDIVYGVCGANAAGTLCPTDMLGSRRTWRPRRRTRLRCRGSSCPPTTPCARAPCCVCWPRDGAVGHGARPQLHVRVRPAVEACVRLRTRWQLSYASAGSYPWGQYACCKYFWYLVFVCAHERTRLLGEFWRIRSPKLTPNSPKFSKYSGGAGTALTTSRRAT